ncbi:MAG: SusC/RagA family TonB-linked outer membrane protein [Cyclobacteriaceae bacterium]|nr:SusC/RagA family TonB-linked outer membrane protein [Cyclobacteriaceae bacterium]
MKKFLLLCFSFVFVLSAWAQERVITGKVSSAEDGSALPGVNVIVKGTTNGSVTDADGKYSLSIPSSGGSLVFSFIGLKTSEIAVGERTIVDVQLGLDVTQLSEIVVTGTGVATDRKKLAISVESITSDRLPSVPAASLDQALVGKIAGAQIFSSSGNPGSPVSIQLRGINTVSGGTQPLIMVDGVQMGATSLNSIDLNNVDRVEVVQGASAATIYGAQGANGVIQIFTKKGKAGPMKLSASYNVSSNDYLNIGNLRQPLNHSFTTDANGDITQTGGGLLSQNSTGIWGSPIWNSGATAKYDKPYKNNTKYYDHISQLFRQAITTNFNVNVSGGKDKSDYSISLSNLKQESVIQGALNRTNLTTNLGFELAKNLTLRSVTQLVYTDNSVNPNGAGLSSAIYTYPFADFKFRAPDGSYLYKFGSGAGANSTNPLYAQEVQKYSNKTIDIIPSLNLHYNLNKFFELDYKVGINYQLGDFSRNTQNQTELASFKFNSAYYTTNSTGQIAKASTNQYNINSIFTALAKVDFAKDLKMDFPLVSSTQLAFDYRNNDFQRVYTTFTGLPSYTPIDLVNGAQASSNAASEYKDRFITYGYLVNQRFEYKDMVGVSGGFRTDFSSTYGDSKQAFTFPRGDAFLRISKFGFWDALSGIVPEFKLRAAYGEAGTQPVNFVGDIVGSVPNHFLRVNTFNTGNVDNGSYLFPQSIVSNPNLKVENSKEFEFGTEFSIAPSSGSWFPFINGSVSVWNRQGTDVVWQRVTPVSAGSESIWDNYISLESNGVQFSLDMDVYRSDNFKWDFVTAFGTSKSFTKNTADGKDIPLTWTSAGTYTLRPGQQFGTLYGYRAITSIDQKDQKGAFYLNQANASNFELVDGRVVDKTSKRVQFTSDKYVLGNTTPAFNMSFTNTFSYKDYLDVSVQIDWVGGAKTYNQTKEWAYSEGLHSDYDKPVTIGGETGAFVAYYRSFYDAVESNGTKDYFLESSSFARLRNLSIAFDAAKFFKLKKFDRLQLVLTGRNLATITDYTGLDPEASQNTSGGGTGSGAGQVAAQRGLDYWSFPNFRSYQIGINIGL